MTQETPATPAESFQLQRLQERIDRQLACMRREITDSMEQVAQRHVQESMELVRSQVLANHGLMQKDVTALQTGIGELRLHVVAVTQDVEERGSLLKTARESWEAAVEEIRQQQHLLRAEFKDIVGTTANGAALAAAGVTSLREELEKVAMRVDSGSQAGEQMLHGIRAQAAELERCIRAQAAEFERDIGQLRAQAAELQRDRDYWRAQLADVKDSCFRQLTEQLEEARVSARAQLSESKFTASLIAEVKDTLIAHVDAQICDTKAAVDTVADHMEEYKNRLDLHKRSIDATLAGSRKEFVGMVEDMRQATHERFEGIQHMAADREQKGAEMTRSLMKDMSKGYQEARSDARGDVKAEADSLRRWVEAGLDTQNAHWRSVLLMMEQKLRELQDSQCDLQTRTCKMQEELSSDLSSGLARLASETYECERHLQDVAHETQRCEQQLQDSSSEARQSQKECHAEQKTEWRELTAAFQQVEERTASQSEQQQHVAKRVEVLAQNVEALRHSAVVQEQLTARVAANTEMEDASLAARVLAAEERQFAKQEMLKRLVEEQMSKVTAELRDCMTSNHIQDDAMRELRRNQDDSVQQLRQTQEDTIQEWRRSQDSAMGQLGELRHSLKLFEGQQQIAQQELHRMHDEATRQLKHSLKECEEEQHVLHKHAQHLQADAAQRVNQSLKSCEETQQVLHEQVQHDFADMAEHLMNFRSSLRDTHESAEQSLQRCEQLMRGQCDFSQELGRSQLQHQELRKEQQNAAAQFVAELNASEARLLTDQRSILAQVHEIGKAHEAQETRAQRCAKRCQLRHAESGEALEVVRAEMIESRKQLFGDVLSEQAVLAQNLQRQIYDAERAAVAKGEHFSEAGARAMCEKLRKEVSLLRHAHDTHRDENAASFSELQEVQRANRLLSSQSHADALAEISACREACFLATQRAAADQAALERNCAAIERSCLERAASVQEDLSVEVRALRDQLLEQTASQEPRLLQLREAVAHLEDQLREAVAQLEDGGSRIASAAAAASSEVRDEVFQEVMQLREKLEAVDDQMIFLRGEVAPDALRSFLHPSVVQCSERAAADQLMRFRKDWGGDVEWRLDCVADCLNSLYLKVGLSTRALAVLRQDTHPS